LFGLWQDVLGQVGLERCLGDLPALRQSELTDGPRPGVPRRLP
jgi:hypothetical protein